ncbi:uncharacterized protein LOC117182886 [Belonocnema kinseyi]|uniref:uncharacterized protein LOC117182886 n=1 Tax=Belonocnema kinseyi TaxID=2817044 RepID=UPI00143D8163|nr:uncharacterized protein LOC117182886 [Belonocnema kinseyi]
MNIVSGSLLFISVIFLYYSIESGSAFRFWRKRSKGKIFQEPTFPLYLHLYEDEKHQIHPITPGSHVTVGIEHNFIVGIIKNGVIRPVLDEEHRRVLVNMRINRNYILSSFTGLPYGRTPEHTAPAIIYSPNVQPLP